MNQKVKIILRELGRINSRSSYFYNMDGDNELLDKIAALIAEHHLNNPRKISKKKYEANKIQRGK